jgi:Domain of unknown function (DUF1772)
VHLLADPFPDVGWRPGAVEVRAQRSKVHRPKTEQCGRRDPRFRLVGSVAGALGQHLRWAAVAAIVVFAVATFVGTVPINAAALDWRPEAPPSDWRTQIERWERLNTVRCWTALLTFALLLAGAAG